MILCKYTTLVSLNHLGTESLKTADQVIARCYQLLMVKLLTCPKDVLHCI